MPMGNYDKISFTPDVPVSVRPGTCFPGGSVGRFIFGGNMKKCSKCGKIVENFYRKWCRQCRDCFLENLKFYNSNMSEERKAKETERKRKWRIENADQMKEIKTAYNKKRYKEDPNIKKHLMERGKKQREWEKENAPEREVARGRLHTAMKSGKIIRPNKCSKCGKYCKPEGSHTDYSKPLKVEWLCKSCHLSKDIKRVFYEQRCRAALAAAKEG